LGRSEEFFSQWSTNWDRGIGYRSEGIFGGTVVEGQGHALSRGLSELQQIAAIAVVLQLIFYSTGGSAATYATSFFSWLMGSNSYIQSWLLSPIGLYEWLGEKWGLPVSGIQWVRSKLPNIFAELGESSAVRTLLSTADLTDLLAYGLAYVPGATFLLQMGGEQVLRLLIGRFLDKSTIALAILIWLGYRQLSGGFEALNQVARNTNSPVAVPRLLQG
jgi:hypothetical protein